MHSCWPEGENEWIWGLVDKGEVKEEKGEGF